MGKGWYEILDDSEEAKSSFKERGHGQTEVTIDKEGIKALLNGKCLGIDDGEYTTILTLSDEVKQLIKEVLVPQSLKGKDDSNG